MQIPPFHVYWGNPALSEFRLEKLVSLCRNIAPVERIYAEYVHVIEHVSELDQEEVTLLEKMLTYGPKGERTNIPKDKNYILVFPRRSTISPWSSKSTEIARNCHLNKVKRIERGICYFVFLKNGQDLTETQTVDISQFLHDKMTQEVVFSIQDTFSFFQHSFPKSFSSVDILKNGKKSLVEANQKFGWALSMDEIEYLCQCYIEKLGRNPSDAELMMFAQVNSEHCRHKVFRAKFFINHQEQKLSLFDMIRNTHKVSPQGTLSAYSDNAAVMKGFPSERLYPNLSSGLYEFHPDDTEILMKVETHNHPTAISPFPGASTGSGGEIRDEGAVGRGSKPKAGLCGFTTSHLNIPGYSQPWETVKTRPLHIASPLEIMTEAPLGAAAFNNEFGRPCLSGYFRTFEAHVGGKHRGFHKPIMIAGGLGNISNQHVLKGQISVGSKIVVLGGPAMLIGLGGGAASSMTQGSSTAELDFASVQRGNPEMQRRCQEVIDACWALRENNPIESIHDVGAGGLSNALPELVNDSGRGAFFELRRIPNDDPQMTPLQIWCNEAQERYVLAISCKKLSTFESICKRERCPFAVLGEATLEKNLVLNDELFKNQPILLPMEILFGSAPQSIRRTTRLAASSPSQNHLLLNADLKESIFRVLQFPSVASKSFLITIGDRSVTGLVARDQMVGPWQVPLADVAVTRMGYSPSLHGEAMAMGERSPIALICPASSAKIAIAESLTNICASYIGDLSSVKLSANWMASVKNESEDAALFDAVQSVGLDMCPALGISIPVGKDSLSMGCKWQDDLGKSVEVYSPVSLIATAFAPVLDISLTQTPDLKACHEESHLYFVDLASGRQRMGFSAFSQTRSHHEGDVPSLDDYDLFKSFFAALQELLFKKLILAYHDRSDGGLFTTIAEMCFGGHTGATISLDGLGTCATSILFNEELGVVIQVSGRNAMAVSKCFEKFGLTNVVHNIGLVDPSDKISIYFQDSLIFEESRIDCQRAWARPSYEMQRIRDNPKSANSEYQNILDAQDPGLFSKLSFDPLFDIPARLSSLADFRPRIAILREQGVNGQLEMAAAFHAVGFSCVDVHMSDILSSKIGLDDFVGLVACGGFSYGDVLGAGEGWAKTILFRPNVKEQFKKFFSRKNTFSLGVCNGCQMLSNLKSIIPGASHWPHFVRNESEQFESRTCMVEILRSPSIFFRGMEGSMLPIAVAHGEGRAEFVDTTPSLKQMNACLRFVDNYGKPTETYPFNPNGSPSGITGLCSSDGRVTILMPHPERVYRTYSNSWVSVQWGKEFGPWVKMFYNARLFVQEN